MYKNGKEEWSTELAKHYQITEEKFIPYKQQEIEGFMVYVQGLFVTDKIERTLYNYCRINWLISSSKSKTAR